MRAHGPARVAVAVWTRLVASTRCLAFWPAGWRRHGGLPFRVVAVCVAVALCAAALVAAPARPALAAPIDPVNPGGDLTFSLSDGTVSPTFMTEVVQNYGPSYFGLPANPTASAMNAAVYQQTQSDDPQTPWAAPPTATGSTFTTSTNPPSLTYTAPASSVPASNIPSGLQGPLAALLTAAVTTPTWYLTDALCLTLWGLGNHQSVDPPGTVAKINCGSLAGAAAAMVGQAMSNPIANVLPDQNSWVKIVGATLITLGLAFPNAKVITPWIENFFVQAGQIITTLVVTGLKLLLFSWLPNGMALVQQYVANYLGANPGNRNLMNAAFALANMPQMVAEGAVINKSLGGPAYQCVDDWQAGGAAENGNPATINVCNSSDDQDWILWSNYALTNGGECLDVTGASWWPKAPLEMYMCSGKWNQVWYQKYTLFGTPQVRNSSIRGYCMDDPNWDTTPGTQLQDEDCSFWTAQRWVLPGNLATSTGTDPTVTGSGPIDPVSSGDCLDAYGATPGANGGASPGQIVAVNSCNGNVTQEWLAWSDGTVTDLGLCLDTNGGTSAAGRPLVDLETCSGAASQVWAQQSDGALLNTASGMCLDDPAFSTTAGTQLQVYACNGGANQVWTLPTTVPGSTPPSSLPPNASVCDIYASGGTPCAAAYSMDRALYVGYDGPLYRVTRASDGTTKDIGLLSAGGDVNASEQDSFCAGTTCTVTEIYDQSPDGNNLTIEQGGGANHSPDNGADATALPIKIGATGSEAYGLDIEPGTGYRLDATKGIATGSQPEGMYMVASGTHVNSGCCFDFGNAETDNNDKGAGHMDSVNVSTTCWYGAANCNGSGPWVEADLENGLYTGGGPNPGDRGNGSNFVTAMLKNNGTNDFELESGDSTSGGLTVGYNGPLPPPPPGSTDQTYTPMSKEGAVLLGTGGDNSNSDYGSWFEGVMTQGYPSDATDAAVQANVVAAGYSGTTSPATSAAASAAGQAVVHAAGATGPAASGYSSVFTVDSANGHLQESYLPYMDDSWTTQDLGKTGGTLPGTPPVMLGTKPVALVHCGYTSVFTVDASNDDLEETYLAALGGSWTSHDLSSSASGMADTPAVKAATDPAAVFHDGYTSVYTVDAATGDLQETYLASIGGSWVTQNLSSMANTPPVAPGTSPVAIVHDGYTSVYTVDANGYLWETFLPVLGGPWHSQNLSSMANIPPVASGTSPTAVYHDGFTSVYTVDAASNDLQETYLPAIFDSWTTQSLSAKYGLPPVTQAFSPVALYHTGFTSVYFPDGRTGDLDEIYLPAIGDAWGWHDMTSTYHVPQTVIFPSPLVHYDFNGALTWTSLFTLDEANADLRETYLPAIGDNWTTQNRSEETR